MLLIFEYFYKFIKDFTYPLLYSTIYSNVTDVTLNIIIYT